MVVGHAWCRPVRRLDGYGRGPLRRWRAGLEEGSLGGVPSVGGMVNEDGLRSRDSRRAGQRLFPICGSGENLFVTPLVVARGPGVGTPRLKAEELMALEPPVTLPRGTNIGGARSVACRELPVVGLAVKETGWPQPFEQRGTGAALRNFRSRQWIMARIVRPGFQPAPSPRIFRQPGRQLNRRSRPPQLPLIFHGPQVELTGILTGLNIRGAAMNMAIPTGGLGFKCRRGIAGLQPQSLLKMLNRRAECCTKRCLWVVPRC